MNREQPIFTNCLKFSNHAKGNKYMPLSPYCDFRNLLELSSNITQGVSKSVGGNLGQTTVKKRLRVIGVLYKRKKKMGIYTGMLGLSVMTVMARRSSM